MPLRSWSGGQGKGNAVLKPDAEMTEPAGDQAGGRPWQVSVWEEGHWREERKEGGPRGRRTGAWNCIYFGLVGRLGGRGVPYPTQASSSLRIIKP